MDTPPPTSEAGAAAARLVRAAVVAGATVAAIGAAALAGWALEVPWLRSAGLEFEVQPNAALGLVLAGLAAVLAARPGRGARWSARALAAAAAALGAATLGEHLLGWNVGIDALLSPGMALGPGTLAPGRMGPPASFGLLAAGIAILLVDTGPRAAAVGQTIAIVAAPVALLAVVGHLYGVRDLYGIAMVNAIAFPTAVAHLLLDVAVLLVRPDRGIAASLAAGGAGGALARRTLVYAVAVPLAAGGAALAGQRSGLLGGEVAIAALVVLLAVAFAALVLRDARALDRMRSAKRRAQAERERSREALAAALRREQEARLQAEQASRIKDQFLATLSHELRTPLNAILGWSGLLREGAADPARLARGLAAIERNGVALAQLVSDLLDMSRVASGKLRLERRAVDLAAVVEAAVDAVQPTALAKRIGIERALAPGIEASADPARVQQIVWNLLANAVKFTPEGGRVSVRLEAWRGRAVLEVEDSGIGIAPEFLPQVFETFSQADGTPSRTHGGLGLGLAISRELVQLHGGTIQAASGGPGRGATFRVELPVSREARAVRVDDAPRPEPARSLLDGARVLVVDDEPDSRDLLLALLGSWGAHATGASSVPEALEAVVRERPDLVLSDIAMPGADGFALVEALRRRERDRGARRVPAAAITAFARVEDRQRALASGFDAHVPKPIQPEELRSTLSALLDEGRPRPAAAG
jgi:signal transduction histidine kinase/ActR/RegA family two-component response regulator